MTATERIAAFLREPALAAVLAALNGDGQETRVVGGAVRDLLLGEPVGDVDLATTALPRETMRRAEAAGFKAVPTGIEHGTVTLIGHGGTFETTTLRRDVATDGRRAVVAFGRDFAEDALRRDFTINALSLSADGQVRDTVGGLDDLAARRVRFIGEAGARIAEDYLRILRFFRFHARYGAGEPDRAGRDACIAGRSGLEALSRERVRAELLKLLVAPGAVGAVAAMAGAGLLAPVLGGAFRLSRFAAVVSSSPHPEEPRSGVSKDAPDVSGASWSILRDAIPTGMAPQDEGSRGVNAAERVWRLAALAVVIREDAERLRERLRLSNEEFDRIARLARAQEMLAGRAEPPTIAGLRHHAHAVGADAVAGALALHATAGAPAVAEVQALIAALGRTPPFLLSGRDVLARGVPVGPDVGRVLEAARRAWIEAGCPAGEGEQDVFLVDIVLSEPPAKEDRP